MPNRLTSPGTPMRLRPVDQKIVADASDASPGSRSLGRTPLYAGCSAPSGSAGQ